MRKVPVLLTPKIKRPYVSLPAPSNDAPGNGRRGEAAAAEDQGDNPMLANMFLLFFGSGTFAMPWGFARAGLMGGLLGTFAVCALTYVTISLLIAAKRLQKQRLFLAARASGTKGKELQGSLSYATIASEAFGSSRIGLLVKCATTCSTLGACGGYLCFIAGLILPIVHRAAAGSSAAAYSSTLGHATANLAFESAEDMSSTTLLLLLMPLVVPLTWIRSFSGLSNVSMVGNVVFTVAGCAVAHDGVTRFGLPTAEDFAYDSGALQMWPSSLSEFSLFVSPVVFMMTVHYCAIPIEAEGRPDGKEFDSALKVSLLLSALLNALFGGLCYVTFGRARTAPSAGGHGQQVEGCDSEPPYMCDDVVKNLSVGPAQVLVSVALVLNLLISYVLMMAPAREYFEAAALTTAVKIWPHTFAPLLPSRRLGLPDDDDGDGEGVELAPVKGGLAGALERAASDEILVKSGSNKGAASHGAAAHSTRIQKAVIGEVDESSSSPEAGVEIEVKKAHVEVAAVDDEVETGHWEPGRDGWARCVLRNVLRAALVFLTLLLSVTVPHFGLLTGLIGGMTDTLQSLVLPPLIYLLETRRPPFMSSAWRSQPSTSSSSSPFTSLQRATSYGAVGSGDAASLESSPPPNFDSSGSSSSSSSSGSTLERKLQTGGLLLLAGFGVCFIGFATHANLGAIAEFLHDQAAAAAAAANSQE